MNTTNYKNTLITVAIDYTAPFAKTNIRAGTIGALQLELLLGSPYLMTSDDLLFEVFALRGKISDADRPAAREKFFQKPQACLRASPLVKSMGYGIHHDENEKIAAFPIESEEYKALLKNPDVKKTAGMRSKRV